MALVHTPAAQIGSPCPPFKLTSVDDIKYSLNSFRDHKALVVMFICNHCPYVKAIEDRLLALAREFAKKPVHFVAICSNDGENYPEDSKENLLKRFKEKKYPFPYLHDVTQKIARDFGAVCTPDFFVYDENNKLAYRGRLDDSWKDESKVTQHDLKDAITNLVSGRAPSATQNSSMGCSIKWL